MHLQSIIANLPSNVDYFLLRSYEGEPIAVIKRRKTTTVRNVFKAIREDLVAKDVELDNINYSELERVINFDVEVTYHEDEDNDIYTFSLVPILVY